MKKLMCKNNKVAKMGDWIHFETVVDDGTKDGGAVIVFMDKFYRLVSVNDRLEIATAKGEVLVGELEANLNLHKTDGEFIDNKFKIVAWYATDVAQHYMDAGLLKANGQRIATGYERWLMEKD